MMAFGRKVTLNLPSKSLPDIAFLKAELFRTTGIKPERQILTYKGVELQSGIFTHYNSRLESSFHARLLETTLIKASTDSIISPYLRKILYLTLRPNEPAVLGIGAGGNVAQDIKRDESDPRFWDIANSRIVNIRLLEATTFRSVTGLTPPGSPIYPQTYAEAGLPVKIRAEPDVESLAVGVKGALEALRGVDASNRHNESPIHRGISFIDPEAEVEGYTDDGLCIAAAQDVITMDVDDTLPGL